MGTKRQKDDAFQGLRLRGGVYWLRVRTGGGERIETSLKTGDPVEAVKRKAEFLQNPVVVSQTDEKLRHQISRFLTHRIRGNWYSQDTADRAENVLNNFADFLGNPPLQQVTKEDVDRFYRSKKASTAATTAISQLMKVRALFRWAVEDAKLIRFNPVLEVKADRVDRTARKDFCDFEQRDRIIGECERPDLKLVFYLGFHAGMRFMEIVEAKRYWFDLKRKVISLRKHPGIRFKDREEREVPMTSELYRFLSSDFEMPDDPNAYLLHPEKQHKRVPRFGKKTWRYRWDFTRPFDLHIKALGYVRPNARGNVVPWVTPHTMRHTFASLLLSEEASIYSVAKWMGDEVRTVESNYGHLIPGHDQIERAFSGRKRPVKAGEASTIPPWSEAPAA